MPTNNKTTNYQLNQWDGNEYPKREDFLADNARIDEALKDSTSAIDAGGTANNILLTAPSILALRNGLKLTIIASANNNGAATTINLNGYGAKNLYKPGTVISPKLMAGKAYDIWYDGTSFFLKASAEGNAQAHHVLATYSISNDDDIGVIGTMIDNGSIGTQTLSTHNSEYTIPQGYHNGLGKVKATISGLIASVIKAGTTVGGILGTFTSDANATASQILNGITAYVNGVKITGTVPSKGAQTYTPSTANQTIAAGQYLSGIQTIASLGGNAVASDVANGKTFSSDSAGRAIAGTGELKKYATGTATSVRTTYGSDVYHRISVSGLAFTPKIIIAKHQSQNVQSYYCDFFSPYAYGAAFDNVSGLMRPIQQGVQNSMDSITTNAFSMVIQYGDSLTAGPYVTWHAFG